MLNMSFWLTTKQCRDKTKDVTRRIGWSNLKASFPIEVRCCKINKRRWMMKTSRLAKAIPMAAGGIVAVIILGTITSNLNMEGWNPLAGIFVTTIFPIILVALIVMVMMKLFVDDKIDSGESAGVLNPIVLLVRKLRGQKARTPEEIAAIINKKMVDDLFTNKPVDEDDCDIHDAKMAREVFGDIEDGVEEGKTRRPMNPIVHLVRHLRKGRG